MIRKAKACFLTLSLLLAMAMVAHDQDNRPGRDRQSAQDTTALDSIRLTYPLKDYPFLNLSPRRKSGFGLDNPSNIKREVIYDPVTRQYIIREKLGSTLYRPPQYFSFEEYQRYED